MTQRRHKHSLEWMTADERPVRLLDLTLAAELRTECLAQRSGGFSGSRGCASTAVALLLPAANAYSRPGFSDSAATRQ